MTSLSAATFAGVFSAVEPIDVIFGEAADDIEAEQETMPDLVDGEDGDHSDDDNSDDEDEFNDIKSMNMEGLRETLGNASKGVSENTNLEYRRLMKHCEAFLIEKGLVKAKGQFFTKSPHEDSAWFIVSWIMHYCDSLNLDGTTKASTIIRASYNHAQKMRAAMTYAFGRIFGLGSMQWRQSEVSGRMVGNPSVSETVSSYMISLRRRKVQAGESATSARAITSEKLKKVYHHNHLPENWTIKEYQPGKRSDKADPAAIHDWGGGRTRRLLQCAYTLMFSCLLRVDEVLKIQVHDIMYNEEDDSFELSLPFRKTSQFGKIEPFVLHVLPEQYAHLCPVRALGEWLGESNITSGYLFRKMASGDRVSKANEPMTAEKFLELFRNNLIDVKIDPSSYGTHSFRRGGCQWLLVELRWNLRDICEWGGWSTEFSHLTIVKYLISWNDSPSKKRSEFFNMNRAPVVQCYTCGRSCPCA